MANYVITGKLGSGKGKGAMKILRDYLLAGKRVATNCDVFLEHMMPAHSRAVIVRIPDKPSISDFYAIGSGNKFIEFEPCILESAKAFEFLPPSPKILPGFDEFHNGALILDECASWLNTRTYADKSRSSLLEWFIHARKYGWDIYFVCQNIDQIDKQLRQSLFEYVVRMNRLDRMKVPFISSGIRLLTAGYSTGSLPRMHIGVVRLGSSPDGIVADRWTFRGDDLNKAYNTTQVFSDSYPHAIHSMLPSWHLQAIAGIPKNFIGPVRIPYDFQLITHRPPPPKKPHKHMIKFLFLSLFLGALLGICGTHFGEPILFPKKLVSAAEPKDIKFSETISGSGFFIDNGAIMLILSDGRFVTPIQFKMTQGGYEALITGGIWIKGIV